MTRVSLESQKLQVQDTGYTFSPSLHLGTSLANCNVTELTPMSECGVDHTLRVTSYQIRTYIALKDIIILVIPIMINES